MSAPTAADLSRWAFMAACAAARYGDTGKMLADRVKAVRELADVLIAMLAAQAVTP